ncbi:MAG: hypothetical protein HKO66_16725 [Saprospiraceae bacterium]|nr:hypothetical protein [Bacteroidia bacterium]NNE13328.1 hypothetical protein [Saprospiraceae bacterium]NNL93891.1 hypothetical protein [Saprospiraceae bacterium]
MTISLAFSSCYYDVEEELYPQLGCETEDMSYQNDIIPILETNCYQCHDAANNFGNVTLDNHSSLLIFVNNGRLLGSLKHESGFSPMPQNAQMLISCNIQKIESWINAGAPNN